MSSRPVIEYYFSFISLWSYIGSRRLLALAEKHNAQIIYKPMDLMRVFSVSGGLPVKQRAPQRQAYRLLEMKRWTEIRKLPIVEHPAFYPADPTLAHKLLLAAIEVHGYDAPSVSEFARKSLEAVWARELDIANKDTILQLATEAKVPDLDTLFRRAEEDASLGDKQEQYTEEAISKRFFGAPLYSYRGEPFWGQDRLEMLDDVLSSGRDAYVLPTEGILEP
ncbi:DSBA-like thioredoxin domain-containing protein [Sarocladium implicatum]|jgi:2-hydroxychromene-2-carboxylate isomerase|nr:DSBA-like thioredoxin domain-containing protein [Sarocladium implicatum]